MIEKTGFNISSEQSNVDLIKSTVHGIPWRSRDMFMVAGSKTFTIPDGITMIRALVWGAGGNGATGTANYPGGGAGGGFVEHWWDCIPGTSLSLVIGAAGGSAGSNGGSSSLVDSVSSISLTATGGAGGIASPTSGASGGTGSGGNITAVGGAGGYGSSTYSGVHGGGGAAGSWLGVGGRGGKFIDFNSNAGCGGGAIGPNNHGGSISGSSGFPCGSGAGVWGPGHCDLSTTVGANGGSGLVPGNAGINGVSSYTISQPTPGSGSAWWEIYDLDGGGGASGPHSGFNGADGGPGAGGGGAAGSTTAFFAGNGGILGGGGGCYGGNGGNGGNGGGGGAGNNSATPGFGRGGDGLIIIYY